MKELFIERNRKKMKITKSKLQRIIKEEVDGVVEEDFGATLVAGALAFALNKMRTSQGREELADLAEFIPSLMETLCDLPEDFTADKGSAIPLIGKAMATSCRVTNWLVPSNAAMKGVAYVLRKMDDDQAAFVSGAIESEAQNQIEGPGEEEE